MISRAIDSLIYLYMLLIVLRILLSWIPTIDWHQQPFYGVSAITDPYLNLFRRFIPPIGMLDISPMVAIIVLQLLMGIL